MTTTCPMCYEFANEPYQYCDEHRPQTAGVDDAKVTIPPVTCSSNEADSEVNRACAFFHRDRRE